MKSLINKNQTEGKIDSSVTNSNNYYKPVTDIYYGDDKATLYLEIPGVTQDNLKVEVEGSELHIEADRSDTLPEAKAIIQERVRGGYRRYFKLSNQINSENITAVLDHGVLKLELPYKEEMKPKTIQIQVK